MPTIELTWEKRHALYVILSNAIDDMEQFIADTDPGRDDHVQCVADLAMAEDILRTVKEA
jgi:hypothetical protein